MKLKNIAAGDFVQIKNSMRHSEFKAKQVCEVIDTDPTDKYGFDVLIQGKNCLDWVNHKDLKKSIKLEPEPQLKQLDQSIFDGLDEKWRFAAIDKCGEVWYSTHRTQPSSSGTHLSSEPNADSMQARDYYDTSNWQNSLIERDTAKELTGSELCKAMLKNQVYVPCFVSDVSEAHAIERKQTAMIDRVYSGLPFIFRSGYNGWTYVVPINNQGEPLTASEVGL